METTDILICNWEKIVTELSSAMNMWSNIYPGQERYLLGMRRSFSHGAVAPRPCIATGKGVGKKIDKVGLHHVGSSYHS